MQDATLGAVPSISSTFIGHSPAVERLKSVAVRVAGRSSTVMILGETGTGKEMLARYIHAQSPRADRPFIPVDCTAFSETLFESQLFGHVRGAFTGAHRDSLGFVRAADGGTLFLDEVGELGLGMQAKLLRVLQERRVVPVGDAIARPVDIRVICATHRDLAAMVVAGSFRQDLYFRLQVFSLQLPPLQQRSEDVLLLAEHGLERLAELSSSDTGPAVSKRLSIAAAEALLRYSWPGNVRELLNVLEHAHVMSDGPEIELQDLPAPLCSGGFRSHIPSELNLSQVERRTIVEALRRCNYNRTAACRLLGLELRRLNRRIGLLKIEIPRRSARTEARRSPERRQGREPSARTESAAAF